MIAHFWYLKCTESAVWIFEMCWVGILNIWNVLSRQHAGICLCSSVLVVSVCDITYIPSKSELVSMGQGPDVNRLCVACQIIPLFPCQYVVVLLNCKPFTHMQYLLIPIRGKCCYTNIKILCWSYLPYNLLMHLEFLFVKLEKSFKKSLILLCCRNPALVILWLYYKGTAVPLLHIPFSFQSQVKFG